MVSRRSFLGYALAMMAFERYERAVAAPPRTFIRRPPAARPRLQYVRMQAHDLAALADFYGHTLGLKPRLAAQKLSIPIGQSTLEFVSAAERTKPYYHFAFTIPENKFEAGRAWLAARTPLLIDRETGRDYIHFENINAHSVYFADSCGNIGELIARHTLISDRAGDFTPPDHDATFNLIRRELAIEPWDGSSIFLGDDDGTIIVFEPNHPWLPERKRPGEVHPTTIVVQGHGRRVVPFAETCLPYVLEDRKSW